jgi:hydrogenase-4 component B
LLAIGLLAASGLVGLLLPRRSAVGAWVACGLMVYAAASGVTGALRAAPGAATTGTAASWSWAVPGSTLAVGLDGLSALFLLPVFVIPALGALYGLGYWSGEEHAATGPKLRLFYGLLAAGMALVVVARDGIVFLMAWELMALSAFFLVTTEEENEGAQQAGWTYLIATHIGTLCLVAAFGGLRAGTGSFALDAAAGQNMAPGLAAGIFALAVVGFGLKAGFMPLHVWLPDAHANAPSHVSAVMSGVMIKMGIYGLVRVSGLLPPVAAGWGGLLLALGVISGVLGLALAIAQQDVKRVLAYCSIENIGVILLGVGLALVGRALRQPEWMILGMAGALLHVWNHSLFKALLFFAAGAVIHATGTRNMDRLGGLARRMPQTALAFALGSVAICGLPPLNGLVSELLIYLGLFRTVGAHGSAAWPAAALVVPLLALVGALAVVCFVRAYGTIFLGEGRTADAQRGHEPVWSMRIPFIVLGLGCAVIGLAPALCLPMLTRAVAAWAPEALEASGGLPGLVPCRWLSGLGIALVVLAGGGYVILRRRLRPGACSVVGTWDCGYAAPTARMQYTGSSLAQTIVQLYARMIRPQWRGPEIDGVFPRTAQFASRVDDALLGRVVRPTFAGAEWLLARLRFLQHGRVQLYILYVLIATVALLAAAVWGGALGQ